MKIKIIIMIIEEGEEEGARGRVGQEKDKREQRERKEERKKRRSWLWLDRRLSEGCGKCINNIYTYNIYSIYMYVILRD